MKAIAITTIGMTIMRNVKNIMTPTIMKATVNTANPYWHAGR